MTSRAIAPGLTTGSASLSKARIAVVGFGTDEATSITATLSEFGCLSRLFPPSLMPLAGEIDSYSAVILNLTPVTNSSLAASPKLLTCKAPLLVIGTCDDISTFAAIEYYAREVLIRPFSNAELAVRLMRCIARAVAIGDGSSGERVPCAVVADDDKCIVNLVSVILRGRGFECKAGGNGRHALELTRTVLPDLLVLDVNMPFLNGFDVLSALRRDPSTSATNILMLTASDRQEDVMRGIDLGASAYLCKPFQPFDFLLRINGLLPGISRTRSTEVPIGALASTPANHRLNT